MNKRRLKKIADFLEHKVKTRRFDLESWASRGFTESKCGSTACVLGWTTVAFPKSGMRLVKEGDGSLIVRLGGVTGFVAAKRFYGISGSDALYLFAPSFYSSAKGRQRMGVVRRIRAFIKQG